jgi:hypothetical protein
VVLQKYGAVEHIAQEFLRIEAGLKLGTFFVIAGVAAHRRQAIGRER